MDGSIEIEDGASVALWIAARAVTAETPSSELYMLMAEALRVEADMGRLIELFVQCSGVAHEALTRSVEHLAKVRSFREQSPPAALALKLLEQRFAFGLLLRAEVDGSLRRYDGRRWARMSDQEIRRDLMALALREPDQFGPANKTVTPALGIIRGIVPSSDGSSRGGLPPVVNTRDAELWIMAEGRLQRRIHRPESGLREVLSVNFDPQAEAPIYEQTIEEIFAKAEQPGEVIRHFEEIAGYALQPLRDIPIVPVLHGGGANGKSTLLGIVQAVLGEELVLAGSLKSLLSDRFTVPDLAGKYLFVEDDADENLQIDPGLLKKVSENKALAARRVRASSTVSFVTTAMVIIATNGVPTISDSSEGLRRRLQVIPFDRRFSADEIDPNVLNKITSTELPGVLNRFLDGLQRLRQRGRFDPPAECIRATEAFLTAANPLREFLAERCDHDPSRRIRLSDFRTAFRAWAKESGHRPSVTDRKLGAALRSMGIVVRKSDVTVVEGVSLKAPV